MTNENYLLIGIIGNSFGYDGYFFLNDTFDAIESLDKDIPAKIGFTAEFSKAYRLEDYKVKSDGKVVAKILGIDSKELLAGFKKQGLFVDRSFILKHNPDFYSYDDVIDCQVFDAHSGELIGKVIEVWTMPANDVWLTETSKGNLPIPVIDDIILKTDFQAKKIEIFKMDGLMDIIEGNEEDRDED